MNSALRCLRDFAFVFAFASACVFCLPVAGGSHARQAEERAESAFNLARGNPLALRAFLVDMPKGAELHYHLVGGIYAETLIRRGGEDHLCVNVAARSFVKRTAANCGNRQRAGGNGSSGSAAVRQAGGCVLDARDSCRRPE